MMVHIEGNLLSKGGLVVKIWSYDFKIIESNPTGGFLG